MKSKLAFLLVASVVLLASCRRQPCPAYGKIMSNETHPQISQ
jgi:hypothetical protein